MNKRNILMITPYLPVPSQSGGQTRSFYLIKHLSQQNNLTLICFTRDNAGLDLIRPYCQKIILIERGKTWDLKKIISTGLSWYPFLVSNYISYKLRKAIEKEINSQKYDLIHTECFYLMPNIPKTNIPIILVDQTIEYAVYQHYTKNLSGWKILLKPLLWLDVLKLRYWEHYYWKHTHTVVAVSQDDKEIIAKDTKRKDVVIVPNGVDPTYLNTSKIIPKTKMPSILYGVSNMKWMQNSECIRILLKYVWPKIRAEIKNAKLYIIGRHAPAIFGYAKSKDVIVAEANLDGEKDDPISYYQRAWLLVAPILSGNGTRTKFFEAMAVGLPIVTTPQGMEGIEIENFKHACVVNFEKVSETAIELLKNSQRRYEIGLAAKSMGQKYSWEESAKILNTLYENLSRT